MLDRGQLDEFIERGFVVVPQVVSRDLVSAASRVIDKLIESAPPGPDVRGPHFYFPETAQTPSLTALLMDSPAFGTAESLTGVGSLEVPWQAQVALNIPPFPTEPSWHHIDGFPPEADGRPGTFTMLASVLMSDQLDDDAGNLWVWPGSHIAHAEYFREHGPDAFFEAGATCRSSRPSRSRSAAGLATCCWRTTCWVTTLGTTLRRRRGARCTSGSSGPGTTPGGASSSRTLGWTTTRCVKSWVEWAGSCRRARRAGARW